jgi:hypothetical protein
VVGEVELAGWRRIATQTAPKANPQGLFPWEPLSRQGGVA